MSLNFMHLCNEHMQKHGSRTDQEESIMENYIRKLPGKQYLARL